MWKLVLREFEQLSQGYTTAKRATQISALRSWDFPSTVLVYYGCHDQILQLMWLKWWKLSFSQLWRMEVQDEGGSRFGCPWGLSPWLTNGHLHTVSTWSLLCGHISGVSLCVQISSSYKDIHYIGLVSTHRTLMPSLKVLFPNTVTFWITGCWDMNINLQGGWGRRSLAHHSHSVRL